MKKTLALALALAVAPFAAAADGLSYTYAEGGYNTVHLDDNDLGSGDADGAFLRGSYNVAPSINLFGGMARVSDSERIAGVRAKSTITQSELGVGYHQSMSDRVDFIAELAWVRFDAKATVGGTTLADGLAHGGRGAVGIRGQFSDNFEGLAKVNYYDGHDLADGEFTGTIGAQYRFNPTWGISGEIEHGDLYGTSTTRYMLGLRASF